jgi:hypothetical protein
MHFTSDVLTKLKIRIQPPSFWLNYLHGIEIVV